ncbi:MAG: helix-turn-helix domain-containing protein [Gimesia chilikensis]|uniref:helix-turn-helix domain-containing protein n=1 Tax=Gimesia chilikensis TaxID=2605989 RepID=UPI00379AC3F6
MGKRRERIISKSEIQSAFEGQDGIRFPLILTADEAAQLLGFETPKTIYEWVSKGRLDKAYVKRGKRILFLRNKLVDEMFNGKDWN